MIARLLESVAGQAVARPSHRERKSKPLDCGNRFAFRHVISETTRHFSISGRCLRLIEDGFGEEIRCNVMTNELCSAHFIFVESPPLPPPLNGGGRVWSSGKATSVQADESKFEPSASW